MGHPSLVFADYFATPYEIKFKISDSVEDNFTVFEIWNGDQYCVFVLSIQEITSVIDWLNTKLKDSTDVSPISE